MTLHSKKQINMPQIAQADARLPIELVDLIAFHLRPADLTAPPSKKLPGPGNGLTGLLSCSLVCHQWRAVLLSHLFSGFHVTCGFEQHFGEGGSDDQAEGVDASADGDPENSSKTLALFCQFLENTPTVRGCIRQLKIVNRSKAPRNLRQNPPQDQLDSTVFARLLQLCPRLDILHLLGVFLSNIRIPHRSERRSLQALKILPCHRGYYQQLFIPPYRPGADVAPLMFFSSIRHLHLCAPMHSTWMLPPTMAFPPLKVHHLEIEKSGYGLQSLVSALRRAGAVKTIRTLTMTLCSRHQVHPVSPELQRLLNLISPTLETVVVRCAFHNPECTHPIMAYYIVLTISPKDLATIPDISQCTRLRLLYVGFDLAAPDVTALVVPLLRAVPPTAPLARLVIRVVLLKGERTLRH